MKLSPESNAIMEKKQKVIHLKYSNMKHTFYFIFILFLSFATVKAQKPVTLTPDSVNIGHTGFPGFWLSIPEVKSAVVKASWIKSIEKGTKSKVKKENDDLTIFGAIIKDVYQGSVNIMSKVVDQDSLCRLFVCVETTRNKFIGKSSPEYEKLSKYLKNFGKDQYVALAKDQLSVENDKLREMDKDLKTARKNNEKYEKNIQSAKTLRSEAKDKINSLNKEVVQVTSDIDSNTTLSASAPDGDAKKAKQSELKTLEKKKKGLLKDIHAAENNISKANSAIDDNTREIALNAETQKAINEKLTKQTLVVNRFENKLKAIKEY